MQLDSFSAKNRYCQVKKKEDKPEGGKEKKKRGAPVGHPGWGRRNPDHIDQTVYVSAPSVCPHCQKDNLDPYSGIHEHVQEDIVIKPVTRNINQCQFRGYKSGHKEDLE